MALTTVVTLEQQTVYTRTVCIKMAQYIPEARQTLRRWIGTGMYDAIEANTSHEYYADAVRAEVLLVLAISKPDLNLRLTEQGGHVKNLGLDTLGNTNILMGANELMAYSTNAYHRARLAVADLLLPTVRRVRPSTYNRV